MNAADRQRIDWQQVPTVFVEAATCAYCCGIKFDYQRSDANGDGSRTRLAICRSCGKPNKISLEIPEAGNVVWPTAYHANEV